MNAMNLYLNAASDYSIVDDAGNRYSPEEAKRLCEEDKVDDCNQSFRRLAENGFDIDALKAWYARTA